MATSRIYTRIVAALFVLSGLAVAIGGVWLAALGGSFGYIILALALLATGILVWMGRPVSLWLYALTLVGALIWALAEVGLDWWALAPRGDVLAVLGILLALPWAVRGLAPTPARRGGWLSLVGGTLYLLGRASHVVCYMKALSPWRSLSFLVALIGCVLMALPLIPHIW